jgi:hypothetical protein
VRCFDGNPDLCPHLLICLVNSAWPPAHSLVRKLAFSMSDLFLTCNFTCKESVLAVLARTNAVLSAL